MSKERLMKVIIGPHISEKSAMAAEGGNQVILKVAVDSNKQEIKAAVELLMDIKVASVRVLNQKGKTKKFGQRMGKRKDWKKAYINLVPGQNIENLTATG